MEHFGIIAIWLVVGMMSYTLLRIFFSRTLSDFYNKEGMAADVGAILYILFGPLTFGYFLGLTLEQLIKK